MGATRAAQFARYDASGRAIRLIDGKLEKYTSGSFWERNRIPSGGILAICADYATASDGLSLLIRNEDYFGAKESATYDLADRAYDGIAEPHGGVFSIAPGRMNIPRSLRAVASDYTSGVIKFARGHSSRAFAMCRKCDIITHSTILSGGVFLLYSEYMRPGGSELCGLFADELDKCARCKTIHRDLPCGIKGYSGISFSGVRPRPLLDLLYGDARYSAARDRAADLLGVEAKLPQSTPYSARSKDGLGEVL